MPQPWAKAVSEIFTITFGKEGGTDKENESPFAHLQVDEMRGALAAIRFLKAAAGELEVLAGYARHELESFEGMTGELEAGELQSPHKPPPKANWRSILSGRAPVVL